MTALSSSGCLYIFCQQQWRLQGADVACQILLCSERRHPSMIIFDDDFICPKDAPVCNFLECLLQILDNFGIVSLVNAGTYFPWRILGMKISEAFWFLFLSVNCMGFSGCGDCGQDHPTPTTFVFMMSWHTAVCPSLSPTTFSHHWTSSYHGRRFMKALRATPNNQRQKSGLFVFTGGKYERPWTSQFMGDYSSILRVSIWIPLRFDFLCLTYMGPCR